MTSIRRRLVVGLSLGVALLWLSAAALSTLTFRHELDEVFDSALRESARRLLALAIAEADEHGILGGTELRVPRRTAWSPLKQADGVYACDDGADDEACGALLSYVVRDGSERIVLGSYDDMAHFPDEFAAGFSNGAAHRLYGERTVDGRFSIQIADPAWHRREALVETMLALVAPMPLLLLASLLLGWAVVRDALRGVRTLRTEIEVRGSDHLAPLSLAGVPSELRPIVASTNELLERLARALDAERSFTSSSAHELRTPIAGALALTQRLLARLPEGDERERARQIADQLGELGRLSAKLMQLARAESGFMSTAELTDGADVVSHVVDEYRARSGGRERLRFRTTGESRFLSRLDPDGLAILLRNLIENALKHAPRDSTVDVVLDGASNTLRIVNGGEPLTSETLARIRRRFERGASGVGGAGLGLAIVDAVLRGSDLALELRSPAGGCEHGFEAILRSAPARHRDPA